MTAPDPPGPHPMRIVDRQNELNELAAFVRGNQSIALVGPSQSGKTMLLSHLCQPATWPSVGLGQDNLFVYISCTMLDEMSHEAIFRQFARSMAAALELRRLPPEHVSEMDPATPARLAWEIVLRRLNRRGMHVVVVLDDFEALSGNPRLGIGFFNVLRSATARYRLVLITASVRPLIELTFSGCSEEIISSPFFNIFAQILLKTPPEQSFHPSEIA